MNKVRTALEKVKTVPMDEKKYDANALSQDTEVVVEELLDESKDVMSEWLDFQYGHTVNQLAVFEKLAKKLVFKIFVISVVCKSVSKGTPQF